MLAANVYEARYQRGQISYPNYGISGCVLGVHTCVSTIYLLHTRYDMEKK